MNYIDFINENCFNLMNCTFNKKKEQLFNCESLHFRINLNQCHYEIQLTFLMNSYHGNSEQMLNNSFGNLNKIKYQQN